MTKILVRPLEAQDFDDWLPLAQGYKLFYNTPATEVEYHSAWVRIIAASDAPAGSQIYGLAAHLEGRLVGIAHYLFHTSVWAQNVCYLQDLFTAESARGQGVARALIEAVARAASDRGASRYYWTTQEHNHTARALYDKVAQYRGFLRYDYPL